MFELLLSLSLYIRSPPPTKKRHFKRKRTVQTCKWNKNFDSQLSGYQYLPKEARGTQQPKAWENSSKEEITQNKNKSRKVLITESQTETIISLLLNEYMYLSLLLLSSVLLLFIVFRVEWINVFVFTVQQLQAVYSLILMLVILTTLFSSQFCMNLIDNQLNPYLLILFCMKNTILIFVVINSSFGRLYPPTVVRCLSIRVTFRELLT